MKVTSRGDLSLESMPPDGDDRWKVFLDDYTDLKRQSVAAFAALNYQDNTKYRDKTLNLVHGAETEVKVPDGVGNPRSVVALQCEGVTLGADGKPNGSIYGLGLDSPIEWRPSDVAGRVLIKARFAPPVGVCSIYRAAAYDFPDNTPSTFPLDTALFSSGSLSFAAGSNAILCAVAGVVAISYAASFSANATGRRRASMLVDGATTDEHGREDDAGAAGNAATMSGAGLARVSAGSVITLHGFQNSGGVLALTVANNMTKLNAHYVAPAIGTTGRVKLLFVGE